jgi:hypothetical protein
MTDQTQKNQTTDERSHAEGPEQGEGADQGAAAKDVPTIDGLDVKEVVELPSGRTAVVHEVLGKHMRFASRVMQDRDAMFGNFEVFHQVVLLEGERLNASEWGEEPWSDLQVLIEKVFPQGSPSQGASVM